MFWWAAHNGRGDLRWLEVRDIGAEQFGEGRRTIGASVHASYGVYYIGPGLRGIALDLGWEKNILALTREPWYNFAPLCAICPWCRLSDEHYEDCWEQEPRPSGLKVIVYCCCSS
jgi:hypothetical protein